MFTFYWVPSGLQKLLQGKASIKRPPGLIRFTSLMASLQPDMSRVSCKSFLTSSWDTLENN